MRNLLAITLLAGALPFAAAQEADAKVEARYRVPGNPRLFPQSAPKEALQSAVKAAENGRFEYVVAHILDPKFVDKRVADRAKDLVETVERDLRALRDAQKASPNLTPVDDRIPVEPEAFKGKVDAEAKLRAFRQVVQDMKDRFTDDPTALKELQRYAREGAFPAEATAAKGTLKDVKDRALYFKFADKRWFLENRQTEEKEGDK